MKLRDIIKNPNLIGDMSSSQSSFQKFCQTLTITDKKTQKEVSRYSILSQLDWISLLCSKYFFWDCRPFKLECCLIYISPYFMFSFLTFFPLNLEAKKELFLSCPHQSVYLCKHTNHIYLKHFINFPNIDFKLSNIKYQY